MRNTLLRSALPLTSVALIAACSGDTALPTAPPAGAPLFNVIDPTAGSVMVCPQGPAGTYTYSISLSFPATFTYQGNTFPWPEPVITAAEANHSLPLGTTPSLTIPSANSNCYEVFRVNASVGYTVPGTNTLVDPRRFVTVTQTGAPAGTVLDSILFTTDEDPAENMKLVFPTTTVQAFANFFHGSVASFWNSTPQTHPGGDPHTIGFWQNWSSCSKGNGNQDPVLDQTLASFSGGGVFIGDLFVSTCTVAVSLLKKSDVVSGANRANDAAYGLAAQLLAAELNVQNGAGTCSAATTAIADAQTLLAGIDFTGTGEFLKTNSTNRTAANALASTLDSYNNGNLCP